jgi:pSer/pThr/pTyr-binding forkhead associated (FHA) protein
VSGPPGVVPTLVMADGERVPVVGELTVGREKADIVVADPEVSRRHAIVRLVGDGLEIADANSANGTFVNDSRIDGVRRLSDGDAVRVGGTTFTVEVPAARPEPAAQPVLVVTEGVGAGERFQVERELSFGRGEADVVLDDAEVSRRHAVVRLSNGALEISDANSANGTFVNGARISGSQVLADGDLIRLGKTTLKVELPQFAGATVVSAGGPQTVVAPPPGT